MLRQVRDPQDCRDAGQGLQELPPVRGEPQLPGLLRGHPRGQELLHPAPVVEEGHHAVAGRCQRPGGVEHALEHGFEFQALVDAQAGLAEARQPLLERLEIAVPLA